MHSKQVICLIALSLTALVSSQNVIFTDDFIKIYSEKDMNFTSTYEAAIQFYRNELLRFKDEILSQKCIACIKLTDYIAKLALESIHYLIRIKRGFRFLGTIINELADIPTGDMWDDQQEMNENLLTITKDEEKEIKDLKKKIKVEHSAINTLETLVQNISSNQLVERAEINALEKLFDDNAIADTYCFKALKTAEKLSFEKEIVYDISHHSKQFLPSRYMFPIDKITPVINEHAKRNRLSAPVFFDENEIYDMMTLQSTITVYDEVNKKLRSILKIPLADFSENMKTFALPNLDQKDMYRLHRLELLGVKKVDRYLCSKRMKSIRLISIEDLKSCQKHVANYENTFICQKRKVQMKHIFDECSRVKKLPPAIIFEVDNEHFLVDHPPQVVKISCISNNITSRENMTITEGPTKIKVPKNCELISEHIEISMSLKESDNISLSEKVKIYRIESRHTSLHDDAVENSNFLFKKINPNEPEPIHHDDDEVEEQVHEDISKAQRKMHQLLSHDHHGFDYATLAISVTTAAVIIVYLLIKVYNCSRKPKLNDIEMNSLDKNKKVEDLTKEVEDLKKKFRELNEKILKDLITKTNEELSSERPQL